MFNVTPLNTETTGEILSIEKFNDLYQEVFDEGRRFLWRATSHQSVEFVIIFEDIEDFERSFTPDATIDFASYRDRFLIVVWTVADSPNPLGFPISFLKNDRVDQLAVEQIFIQDHLPVHYVTLVDDQLLHIFSQEMDFPKDEKARAIAIYHQEHDDKQAQEEMLMNERQADHLTDQQLKDYGIGYLLDFSSLLRKNDEEQAKEKLMSAVVTAAEMFMNHPRPEIRDSSFIIWAGEKREKAEQGETSALTEIYITPPLLEHFDIVNDNQLNENPLSTVMLSFPEFLTTIEAKPVDRGAYPILQYDSHQLWYIEPNEGLGQRLASLSGMMPNPYLNS